MSVKDQLARPTLAYTTPTSGRLFLLSPSRYLSTSTCSRTSRCKFRAWVSSRSSDRGGAQIRAAVPVFVSAGAAVPGHLRGCAAVSACGAGRALPLHDRQAQGRWRRICGQGPAAGEAEAKISQTRPIEAWKLWRQDASLAHECELE